MPDTINLEVAKRKTEMWDIDKLSQNVRNARQHTRQQVEQLARSLQDFGWTFPILVDEKGIIIAGHGRWMAAGTLGVKQVPVIVARGWTEEQKRAYLIADNKLTENASWDETLLARELSELRDLNVDLDVIGFSEDELSSLFKTLKGPEAPPDFPSFDDEIDVQHTCPKCGYQWSGG